MQKRASVLTKVNRIAGPLATLYPSARLSNSHGNGCIPLKTKLSRLSKWEYGLRTIFPVAMISDITASPIRLYTPYHHCVYTTALWNIWSGHLHSSHIWLERPQVRRKKPDPNSLNSLMLPLTVWNILCEWKPMYISSAIIYTETTCMNHGITVICVVGSGLPKSRPLVLTVKQMSQQ